MRWLTVEKIVLTIGLALLVWFFVASYRAEAAGPPVTAIPSGGTATSSLPAYGNVLIGGKNGEYEFAASSTFGAGAAPVQTVFGRVGAVTAQSGDYNTGLVTEGSNLYFTNARALAAFISDLAATTSVASITTLPNLSLPYGQLTGKPTALSAFTNDVGYMLSSAFNGLFDTRLSATTSLPNITTLSGLSLPYSQVTGKPTALSSFTNDVGFVTSSFSTTSASYFSSLGLAFSTTSANYNFNTNLAATTSVKSITTLPTLTLPYAQLSGTPATGVSSVFTRTGAVVAQNGDYTTSQVTEASNLYYTSARSLADFITNLSATTSVKSIATLPALSLPYTQVTGTPTILPYPFPGGATTTVVTFSNGLTGNVTGNVTGSAGSVSNALTFNSSGAGASSGTTFNGSAAQTISYNTIGAQVAGTYDTFAYPFPGNATTSTITLGAIKLSNVTGSTQCLHADSSGNVTGTGSDCGTGSGGVTGVATLAPLITSGSVGSITLSTSFSTSTFNAFSAENTFGGIFSTNASSSNATTTNFAITGPASNCGGTNALTTNSSGIVGCTAQPQGTVTGISVATANGFAGSSSGGASPALTLSTTITGLLKGNGTAISAATPGTDYDVFGYPFLGNATSTNITFSGGITGNVTGNSSTATALAANGTNCSAGSYALGVDASGNAEGCTVANLGTLTAVTGTFPIVSSGGTTPNITFGGLSTSTAAVLGNIPYFSGVNTFANVATGTIANGAGISVTAGQSVIGSGLTITNTGVTSNVAGTGISVSGATGAVTITNSGVTSIVAGTNVTVSGATGAVTINATGGSSFAYPFINNATSSVLSFGSGLVSLGSTTFASNVNLSAFSNGALAVSNHALYSTATTTLVAGTNVTFSGGPVAVFGSTPLTINASGGGGTYPFTPSTFGLLAVSATTTALYPSGLVTGTSTIGTLVATSSITNNSVKNALVLNGATGLEGAYGGISCTNQFVAAVSAAGVGTCFSVTTSQFGSVGANTILGNFTGAPAVPTFSATSTLFTGSAGQTAFFSGAGALLGTSTMSINTTTGQVTFKDFATGYSGIQSPVRAASLQTGTTTGWTGTTSNPYIPSSIAPFAGTMKDIKCATDASFLGIEVDINGSPVAPAYFVASTTKGVITFTGSNTFNYGDTLSMKAGTTTTATATTVFCTLRIVQTT